MTPADRKNFSYSAVHVQKPVIADVNAVSLDTPGAYLHVSNDRLTTDLMKGFTDKPAYFDLVQVCDQWYARPPRSPRAFGIADQHGKAKEVHLSPVRIAGVW